MQIRIIDPWEIEELKVASLPSRPTASAALGGKGFTAREMKEAFDKLPLFILERLNLLIEELSAEGSDSYVGSFQTGIKTDHTLNDLFLEIKGGNFINYLKIDGTPLADKLRLIEEEISAIKARTGG